MNELPNIPLDQRDVVDLRSDTVTRPTPEMYAAMCAAPIGDDVLGDDPTVIELEELAAARSGKEAALFVSSGTMGNQLAIVSQTNRGDAILAESEAHILFYEGGAPAILANVLTFTIDSRLGTMDPDEVAARVTRESLHTPGTTMLCVENTHNRAGGTIIDPDAIARYRKICDENGIVLHLDGARFFHAAVESQVPVAKMLEPFDSVSLCLSKGLASPVGSVLCGKREMIERARHWRKRLGGGLRQSGILAACGLVSLRQMVDRLREDHRRARELAQGLDGLPGIHIDWERVQTNIILLETDRPASEWLTGLRSKGIWALPPAPNRIRLVLHKDVDDDGVAKTIEAFRAISVSI